MEYAGNSSLSDILEKARKGLAPNEWTETKKLIFIYSLALGLAHIHSQNIIHRDIKPGNILLDDYLLPKISDFGLSAIGQEDLDIQYIGTPVYMAPEIIQGEKHSKQVDVFSFALVVYEIVTLNLPYDKNVAGRGDISKARVNGKRPQIDEIVPKAFRRLITKCWAQDPQDRPTFNQIVKILKSDRGFITDMVDKQEYLDFIYFIDHHDGEAVFSFPKVQIDFKAGKELLVDLDEIDLNLYEKEEFIGEGQFRKVFKIRNKTTGAIFAAKENKLLLENCDGDQIKNLSNEINILYKLKDSPLIVNFIGFNQLNFKTETKPTIITEFIKNTSLQSIIDLNNSGLKPPEWSYTKLLIVTHGIASGMSFLHSLNILHRDLKPENVFLDEFLFPKIGDFGLSKEIPKDGNPPPSSSNVGTPAFMSPEIFEKYEYSKASDVYAFSILLYSIATFESPFEGLTFYNLPSRVINGTRPVFHADVPNCFKELITQCWQGDPKKRPTFDQIVNDLRNNEEFLLEEEVDEDEFKNYIKFVNDHKVNDSFKKVTLNLEELRRIQENDPVLNVPYLDLSKYEKKKAIKKVDYFKIYEIKHKETNILYEAKISTIKIAKLSKNDIIHLSRETNILSQLNHPTYIKFIGYSPIDFNMRPMPVLVNEMPPNKSLNDLLNKERNKEHLNEWDETKRLICIFGIVAGMSFLHLHDIIHRNLSPESIFFDEHLFPKIGNFGLLTRIHTVETITYQSSVGVKGRPNYSAPEVLESNEYSKRSDVYAFALVVFELLTLEVPFKNLSNINSIYNEVVSRGLRPSFNVNVDEPFRKLIEKCWSQNPNERPSFDEIESMLKNDKKFITRNVNEQAFRDYVNHIEQSEAEFYSMNRVVNFNNLINKKEETPKESSENNKPKDKDKETKPQDKDKETKPKDKDKETKPQDKDKETKPQDKDKETKPKDKDKETKPQDKDKEAKPKDKDKETKPKDKDKETKPQDKDKETKPQDKDKETKPKDKDKEVKPKDKDKETKPQDKDKEVKPKDKDKETKPQDKDKEVKPKDKDKETKPQDKDKEVKPKDKDKETKPQDKDKEVKPKDKDKETKPQDKDKEVKPKDKDKETKPKDKDKETKPQDKDKETKPQDKDKETKPQDKDKEVKPKDKDKETKPQDKDKESKMLNKNLKYDAKIENSLKKIMSKEFIGNIGADLIAILLNDSTCIDSSAVFTSYKVKIETDFILIKILKRKDDYNTQRGKQEELKNFGQFISEYRGVNDLGHPNIGKIFGFFEGNKNHPPTVLFEYFPRSLKDAIHTLDDAYLVTIIFEIAHAMDLAHLYHLIHLNLNPENIFIDEENHAKITGFGIDNFLNSTEQVGLDYSVFCLPQEVLENKKCDEKVDVFSFGMIMLFIVTRGKGPFLSRDDIKSEKIPRKPKNVKEISHKIIRNCLLYSPEKRPKFKEIVKFIKKSNFELIEGVESKVEFIKNHLRSNNKT